MKRLAAMSCLVSLALVAPVQAQSTTESAGAASMEAGYGSSGQVANRAFNPVTRDANGNRLIVNGAIVNNGGGSTLTYSSTSSNTLSGAAYFERGAEGLQNGTTSTSGSTATAIGNLVNISVVGRGNVIILNSTQTNTGDVSASTPQG